MSLIALYPRAWHQAMDPLLADWDSRLANDVERSLVRDRGGTVATTPKPTAKAFAFAMEEPAEDHNVR
jgi:hypothetical protein